MSVAPSAGDVIFSPPSVPPGPCQVAVCPLEQAETPSSANIARKASRVAMTRDARARLVVSTHPWCPTVGSPQTHPYPIGLVTLGQIGVSAQRRSSGHGVALFVATGSRRDRVRARHADRDRYDAVLDVVVPRHVPGPPAVAGCDVNPRTADAHRVADERVLVDPLGVGRADIDAAMTHVEVALCVYRPGRRVQEHAAPRQALGVVD